MSYTGKIYQAIIDAKRAKKKLFAVLIDPDKAGGEQTESIVKKCNDCGVDLIFVGGSLLSNPITLTGLIKNIKALTSIPVLLFPGSPLQVSNDADGILLLSLISGRNADLLIGQQVIAAPYLKASELEILSTGYMLIDGGKPTTVSYISNTAPIPCDKPDVAACTALAGEMLGLKLIYLETGSGAKKPVSAEMIKAVAETVSLPLIVGGGINSAEKAEAACRAGADIVVIGNALEKDLSLLKEAVAATRYAGAAGTPVS